MFAGKPARVQDKEDPDWIPSLNLTFKQAPSLTKKQTKESQRLKRKSDKTENNEITAPKKSKDAIETESQKDPKSQIIEIPRVEELSKCLTKIEIEQEPIEYFEPYKKIEVEASNEIDVQNLPMVEHTIVVETTQREDAIENTQRKDVTRLELEIAKRKIRELQKQLDNKQNEVLRKNIEILNLKRKLTSSQQEVLNLQNSISIQEQPEENVVEEENTEPAESAVVSDINSYTTVAGKKLYYVVVNKDRFLQIPLP